MAYTSSTFIKTFIASAKAIEIQNSIGQKVFTINVCNYQKSIVLDSYLQIVIEANTEKKQYLLEFASKSEAIAAEFQLKNSINTLKINCEPQTIVPAGPTPLPITYLQYKNLQSTNSLIALQWYDISDTTNLLGLGGVIIRGLAKTTDDYEPAGIILNSKQLVTLSILDDTIQRFEVGEKKILATNNSKIIYDTTSHHLTANTNSIINSTASSNVDVKGNSTAILTDCNFIDISNNSNVILKNALKVVIDNIQQDLTTLGFNLQNVCINQSDTLGKFGKELKINPNSQTLLSYDSLVEQELRIDINNNNINIVLDNKIIQSNGQFKIKYTGTGTGNIINILNKNNTTLFTLNDTKKDVWAIFSFNISTSLFEFTNLDFTNLSHHIVYREIAINNQVNFNLPSPATDATKLQMFINGQKQLFGLDFTYSSPGLLIYQNRNFILQTNDEIEILIF